MVLRAVMGRMEDIELFHRLALAVAIGAVIGVERHWRDREAGQGQRTAGLRTFALIGLFGGVAGLIERDLAGTLAAPSGIVLASFFIVLTGAITAFQYRESIAEGSFSATTVVAAMLTFALGAQAVLGNMQIASAGAVVLLVILASREYLHGAMRKLRWAELRSAVILLALTFVLLPVVPADAIGPFGGISPARILKLVIVLASISFCGYVAVRMLGATRGALVAGAVGGIVSSTAVTITNAQRSKTEEGTNALAAGAIGAGAISFLRTAILVSALAAVLVPILVPALVAGAVAMIAYAAVLAWRDTAENPEQTQKNPFELWSVIKMALLLVGVAFLAQAASQLFGNAGLIIVSALSGLADVDAATVTVTGMINRISPQVGAEAIAIALFSNVVAKAVYASIWGSAGYRLHLWLASIAAAVASGAGLFFTLG
ncbi:membrane protein [Sphingomonas sp. DBB INV C78]|uniref:MgtC/SapB family protein n=1 Tax=Sphingomonas sp. DBB INV C78 TaxID=3349434 RepID=UPI0036D384DC